MIYELHPLCSLFPRMAGTEFAALVADIAANGQREPIIIHEQMILDGGNRYRACLDAGVEPQVMRFGGGNLVAYVLSANLHRRHMSAGQQAAIVASAQDWARQAASGSNQHVSAYGEGVAAATPPDVDTVASRAALSGASRATQQRADSVARADPELAQRVARGEVSLPAAVEQVTGKRPGKKSEPDDATARDVYGPDEAELASSLAQDEADRKALDILLAADDKLSAAHAEMKRLYAVIVVLESRIQGLQNEANEAKRIAKMWQRKAGLTA